METKEMEELKDLLFHYIGTENYYHDPRFPNVVYTDGIKALFEKASCYWLLDTVALHFYRKWQEYCFKNEDWGVLTFMISVREDCSCSLVLRKGEEELAREDLSFTTFPIGTFEFYISLAALENSTGKMLMFLKSEY